MTRPSPALVGLLALLGCSGARPGVGPGGPLPADADGDGWSEAEGDCDDNDPMSFPEAPDIPGDGVDADCDGDDTAPLAAAGLEPGQLVITEVQKDPLAIDSALAEWFEVFNASGVEIDLEGLVIADELGPDVTVRRNLVVPADGWVVLGAWEEPELNGGAPVDWSWGGEISLSNGEDTLALLRPDGLEIERLAWDARFPDEPGRAMSLDPAFQSAEGNDLPESWCPAIAPYGLAGYGSPGAANPSCEPFEGLTLAEVEVGELVITEILQNPDLGDADDGEWIEVTNLSDEPIDLRGLEVADQSGSFETVQDPLVIEPGAYLVFTAGDDPATNGGIVPDWSWENAFGLANSEDFVLLRFGTRIYDTVAWDNGVSFPDPSGASMSLDPAATDEALNDDGGNWCPGTTPFGDGDLGTPGAANPGC